MSKSLLKICLLVLGVVFGGGAMMFVSEQSIARAQESHRSEFSFSGQSMIHLESPLQLVGNENRSPDVS